jgi:hypothetical protein
LYEGIYDEKILRNIAATLDTDKEVIKEELCVDFIFNFYNNYFNFINKPHYVYKLKVLIAGIF